MNETQQIQTIDAHVVAFRNEEWYKTSKVKIADRKFPDSVIANLEKVRRELTYFSQEQEVEISYIKVEDGFENRHIYQLKVTQPMKLKLYEGNDEHWKQSGQNMNIGKNIIDSVEKATGTKLDDISLHLGKLITDRLNKIDQETVSLEATFVKTVKRKNYAIRSD